MSPSKDDKAGQGLMGTNDHFLSFGNLFALFQEAIISLYFSNNELFENVYWTMVQFGQKKKDL